MSGYAKVRNGSKATELSRPRRVRFTPDSERERTDIQTGLGCWILHRPTRGAA